MAHHCGSTLGRTVQARTDRSAVAKTAGQLRPILKCIVQTTVQAHTPGSAGALAGMIFRAATNLPSNR
ncbi:MAG: hypothetical protein EB107_09820 [Proteobacteria bacterium]|nr:hypothetical protein [Pseudomonadota bacterium]